MSEYRYRRTRIKALVLMLCAQAFVVSCARSEPPLPTDAIGSSNYKEGTTKFRGRFLLRTGESTDDGTIRVRWLNCCLQKSPATPATLRREQESELHFSGYRTAKF